MVLEEEESSAAETNPVAGEENIAVVSSGDVPILNDRSWVLLKLGGVLKLMDNVGSEASLWLMGYAVELEDQSSLSRPGGNRSAKSLIKEPVADSIEAHSSVNIGNSSVLEESSFYYAFDEHHLPSEILDVKVGTDMVSQDALEICDANENQITEVKEPTTLHPCDDDGKSEHCINAEAGRLSLLGKGTMEETVGSRSNSSCIATTVNLANSLSDLHFSGTVDLVDTDDWKSSGKETHSNGPSAEADDKTIHFIPPPYELQSNSLELESITSSTHNGSLEENEASLDCAANVGVEDVEAATHAGEVYAEKAVLATEVRELQSRLCCFSDERDKALAILNEMQNVFCIVLLSLWDAREHMRLGLNEYQTPEEEEEATSPELKWLAMRNLCLATIDEDADILIYINCPGGSTYSVLAIYDSISWVGTVCFGVAASQGALLLAVGEKGMRYAMPNARIMIHQPQSGCGYGHVEDVRHQVNEAVQSRHKIDKMYSAFTGQPLEKVQQYTERGRFLSVADAMEFGLIDGVLETEY
ncbi:hypothetical protein MLD38_036105 [Melastoma candidum]|uniref:Uncharacterized protein n=1 Tax=Melastoma candidum TaxID=119954 RepID=A0ACB9LI15_9MYRT|nr:hypothetical protein MLD38_036105 [Melastoma candidum]